MKALLIGGSGPTGPHIANGLLERGFELAMLHTGKHELPELAHLEHLHGDPYSRASVEELLAARRFDVAVATYGRVKYLAEALSGRCDRLVTISGLPVYAAYAARGAAGPFPMSAVVAESAPKTPSTWKDLPFSADRVLATEAAVLRLHEEGAFQATIIRYPVIYGPRNPTPLLEWSVVRRLLDGRPFIVLPDGGLSIHSRLAAENAAHAVLLALDLPDSPGGRVYNVADDWQYTTRQWVDTICAIMDRELEVVSIPGTIPSPGWALFPFGYPAIAPHLVVDTARARRELGYQDVVEPFDALASTVAWYVRHGAEIASERLPDAFDYDGEDRLVGVYSDLLDGLREAGGAFSSVTPTPLRQSQSGH